jgi:hypothetical protein
MINENNKLVSNYIKDYAMSMLARSVYDVTFSEYGKPYAHDMAISQMVSSLELLIKSKLIETDPFCIFNENITSIDWNDENILLNLKTKAYMELPKILKDKLSIIVDESIYKELGMKRNRAIHLGNLTIENKTEYVLKSVFEFILPLIMSMEIEIEPFFIFLGEWDEVLFDGYLLEQIELFKINVPKNLKNKIESYA